MVAARAARHSEFSVVRSLQCGRGIDITGMFALHELGKRDAAGPGKCR